MSYLGVGHFPEEEYKKIIALKSRATYRERLNPLSRKKDVGFRCAKDKLSLYEKFFGKTFPTKIQKDYVDSSNLNKIFAAYRQ